MHHETKQNKFLILAVAAMLAGQYHRPVVKGAKAAFAKTRQGVARMARLTVK